MHRHSWFLMGLAAAVVWITEAAMAAQPMTLAQAPAPQGVQRQRAPGVPIVPNPGTVAKREGESSAPPASPPRGTPRGIGPESDLPMPRGVPSIMAP